MLMLRALGVWLLILVLAIVNGGLREWLLLPHLGLPLAQWLSGAILSLCILAVACVFVPRLGAQTTRMLLGLGAFWLLMTLVFEFGFGRLVQARAWHELLQAYTFKDGNLWPLVLVITFLAPLIGARIMRQGKN